MRWFGNPAAIMAVATVSRWMMASLVSVCRVSLILCAVPGSEIGSYRVLRPYKLKSPVPKDWSDVQNVVRHFWQNPTVPSIVPIVPARYTAARKQQVTGNGGRIRTNRAFKSWINTRFPARQPWRWIPILLIAQKSHSNCPHGGTCHGYKTFLYSSKATGPKFYTTAQFFVWGTKFLLLVKRSQTAVCDDLASNGFVPQKRMGRRIWENLSVLPHQRGVWVAALWPSKSGGHAAGATICRSCIHQKTGVWKTQPYLPKTLWSGFKHRLQEIRLRNAGRLKNESNKYGNLLSWSTKNRR